MTSIFWGRVAASATAWVEEGRELEVGKHEEKVGCGSRV
jgi:hypothetical protein